MKITYLGTTTLLFDDGKDQILFDCHVTRPSMKKSLTGLLDSDANLVDRVISDYEINRLRGIFISHSHYDHILDTPGFAVKCNCHVFGSLSSKNIALGNGVPKNKIHCYSEQMDYQIGKFHILVIPSIHSKPHWYNNDLGMIVEEPFTMPASKKAFKEGGSYDFLVTHHDKKYLIRPSYNYLENQLNDMQAHVLFLGIGGMSKDTKERQEIFFKETIDKVKPEVVIPVHWDNFFSPLYGDVKGMPTLLENTGKTMRILADHCMRQKIQCLVQLPLTSVYL